MPFPCCRPTRHNQAGFTLVELLAVIAILATLAAILFPVFALAREKARQSACISSERQLGLALLQYALDYDETFPNGLNVNGRNRLWPGEGWAGQCLPYGRSPALYRCPSDSWHGSRVNDYVASYGYNFNLVKYGDENDPPPPGVSLAEMMAPAKSVLLFEVTGVAANLADPQEGAEPGGILGTNFSADGNGLDNRLYAQHAHVTSIKNQYATGYLGGRKPFNPDATQFASSQGRHSGGSDFLLGDGHARWLRGANVSSGLNALSEPCNQDNCPVIAGCGGAFYAAGTGSMAGGVRATFSVN